jgi:hypothetical protein
MHRAGTSALTGVLSHLGAQTPKTIMTADSYNPTGYGESRAFYAFHERLLASAGSAWTDFAPFNPGWFKSPIAEHFGAELRDLIAAEFGSAPFFLMKDPRICRFLPFWLLQLERLAITPKAIICVRNPLEIAASLNRRDGLSIRRSLLLWLRHALDGEAGTRKLRRAFVHYEDLLSDWRGVVQRLERELDLSWPNRSSKTEQEIDELLCQEFKHHHCSQDELLRRENVPDWVKTVYLILADGVPSGKARSFAKLDQVRNQFNVACRVMGLLVAESEAKLSAAVAEQEQRYEEFAGEIAARDSRIAELTANVVNRDSCLAARCSELEDLRAELAAEASAVSAIRAKHDEDVKRLNARISDLKAHLASIYTSVYWRIASPFRVVRRGISRAFRPLRMKFEGKDQCHRRE